MRVPLDCCMLPWDAELLDWLRHLEVQHAAPGQLTDLLLGAIVTGHQLSLVMTTDDPPRVVGLQVPLL